MRLSAEALLMVLALALYLYDAGLLLASNEATLVRGWRGRWHAGFGLNRWKLAGREPYLPNPLTPQRPLFRLQWAFAAEPSAPAATALLQVPTELAVLGGFTINAALCLFVLLPIGLFSPLGLPVTLAALVLLYVNNIVALALVGWWRSRLHLTGAKWAGLAFECLVCPPFAINLVRRLCAQVPVGETFTAAAARLMGDDEATAEARAEMNAQCLARVDEQIDSAAEGSPHMQALHAARARFAAKDAP